MDNDSLKIASFNSMGKAYLDKNEKLLAFRNYLQALNIGEASEKYSHLTVCYYTMSAFYADIEEYEKAKDFIYKVIALTFRHKKPMDRNEAYNRLGKIYTNNKQYDLAIGFFEKSLAIADSLKFEFIKLDTYSNIITMYASSNQVKKAIEFLNSKPEFKALIKQIRQDYFLDHAYGMAHMETGRMDSAFYFLKKAEVGFEKNASIYGKHWFFNSVASYYKKKGDYKNALAYNLKSKAIADEIGDVELRQEDSMYLDSIYQKIGDYKNAYRYHREYQQAKDSAEKLSAEKDLMVLEVENENKRKEREGQLAIEALRARHNIQYMGITIAIAGVFILLVMFGIFSVSEGTIRVLGFFAFIFLFEFIILLADNQIHHWTHGEPWKILVIKIGLISILLPFHHYLEKKVINYLTSKKMFELNKDVILAKFAPKKASS